MFLGDGVWERKGKEHKVPWLRSSLLQTRGTLLKTVVFQVVTQKMIKLTEAEGAASMCFENEYGFHIYVRVFWIPFWIRYYSDH